MKISIIGPNTPIPPKGWGAVETLIWDMKLALNKMGHEVQIINIGNPNEILNQLWQFRPDFVHINYDDWVCLYPYIQYPCACTTHFAYLEQPKKMGDYATRVFSQFAAIKPNVFGLSEGINDSYHNNAGIPRDRLFLNPNGVQLLDFSYKKEPEYPDRSIYLAKVDYRKRQYLFQGIESLWFAGNVEDGRFDGSNNHLGEWRRQDVGTYLTNYGNLVLLSDGEAHPLVCLEAFAAGLGVVISEWSTANLDLDKKFITVIPEDKMLDQSYIEQKLIENREYSINNRDEIRKYGEQFDWVKVLRKYYMPNIGKIIAQYNQ